MTDQKPAQTPSARGAAAARRAFCCCLGFLSLVSLGLVACSKSHAPAASRLGGKAEPRDEDKSAAHGRLSALVAEQLDSELQ